MEQVSVKVGEVRTVNGMDQSSYIVVTFVGERLGFTRTYADDRATRGRDVEIYAVGEDDGGGFAVYEVVWSLWAGETDEHRLYYYNTWAEMEHEWRATLERAGVIERRKLTLREFVARHDG